MRKRGILLIFLLLLRFILGWIFVLPFKPGENVRITGYAINTYQDISKCIIKIDKFKFFTDDICAKFLNQQIRVIGKIDKTVIDTISGSLWLNNAEIEDFEKTQKIENSSTKTREALDNFRMFLVYRFKKYVPEPEAGLVSGIVLGYKKDIGREFYQQMIDSGTIHIAVASGYNVLLVGGVVLSLCFYFCRRKLAIWIALGFIIFYAVLAGAEAPVVRAVWMAGLMYLGQVLGRGSISGWILTLTAWVMLMIEPALIVSTSFQLSVAASFGLIVLEPWLSKKISSKAGGGLIEFVGRVGLLTTLSTMVATMPVLWWHFGRTNFMGIFSNVLILPLVPPLMIFGAGMIVLPWVFSWPVYALAHWIVVVIRFFGT